VWGTQRTRGTYSGGEAAEGGCSWLGRGGLALHPQVLRPKTTGDGSIQFISDQEKLPQKIEKPFPGRQLNPYLFIFFSFIKIFESSLVTGISSCSYDLGTSFIYKIIYFGAAAANNYSVNNVF